MGRKKILIPLHETPTFSDEWVKHNSWMGKANEEAEKEAEKKLTQLERFRAIPYSFVNFPNGIPMPNIQKEMKQIRDFMAEQEERMKIFEEMLNEKAIRPGRSGVGEPHRGWGRSARKY